MVRSLVLYEEYSRQEVQEIFDPDYAFTPQRGRWGLRGIISIPERDGDYVFLLLLVKKYLGMFLKKV